MIKFLISRFKVPSTILYKCSMITLLIDTNGIELRYFIKSIKLFICSIDFIYGFLSQNRNSWNRPANFSIYWKSCNWEFVWLEMPSSSNSIFYCMSFKVTSLYISSKVSWFFICFCVVNFCIFKHKFSKSAEPLESGYGAFGLFDCYYGLSRPSTWFFLFWDETVCFWWFRTVSRLEALRPSLCKMFEFVSFSTVLIVVSI